MVCPEQNDGEALMRTLNDLRSLAPAAETAALVPVGLTKFREGLFPLRTFTREEARALLKMIAPFQEECRRTLGTTFAFPSDEFFCIAGLEVPEEDWYEDFPQIENGVGLLRRQVSEMEEAQKFDDDPPPEGERRYVIPTGVSFAPQLLRSAEYHGAGGAGAEPFLRRDHHRDRPSDRRRYSGSADPGGLRRHEGDHAVQRDPSPRTGSFSG